MPQRTQLVRFSWDGPFGTLIGIDRCAQTAIVHTIKATHSVAHTAHFCQAAARKKRSKTGPNGAGART